MDVMCPIVAWMRNKYFYPIQRRLTTLGNIITLYSALYIIALSEVFNILHFERKYVPKSKRWNRLTSVTTKMSETVRYSLSPVMDWISNLEEDWSDYYTTRVPEMEYRQARRMHYLAESMNEDFSPLTKEDWIEQKPDYKWPKRKIHHAFWRIRRAEILGMETLIVNTTTNFAGEEVRDNRVHFDTDSGRIGIDNRASACISHYIGDFVGPLVKVNRAIKGFGGERVWNVYKGTLVWRFCDDEGQVHRFKIPDSYYIPRGKCRLLSPQHWAKSQLGKAGAKSQSGIPAQAKEGIGETTTFDRCILFWNDRRNKLTVMMGATDNVATFYLAPGFKRFGLFCQECKIDYDKSQEEPIYAMPAGIVSDDENDDDDADDDVSPPQETNRNTSFWSHLTRPLTRPKQASPEQTPEARRADFDLDGPTVTGSPKPVVIDEEEEKQATTAAQELLRYHHQFGHASFAKLQNMAKQNIIPRRLAKCQVPTCSACLFAKATRRQWRNKRRKHWTEKKQPMKPGEVVSVDQLISPTPGLVAQMTGTLTKQRYKCATIYVDQYSGLGYVYLQKSTDADETIKGKKAFEAYAKQHGVSIRAYHADNGVFRANKWIDDCRKSEQGLTFAGVNAHHSNGLAERRIRSLQDLARAMLIHQNKRWDMPGLVHLWPYALRMANDAINETPNLKDKQGRSPLQLFSQTEVQLHEKHWVPFGCPVYVLHSKLQTGNIFNKWDSRARVGIYLGRSPNHGRNVALVLDRVTGLVSPQFHVKFDKSFNTVKQDKFDTHWQLKAGFLGADLKPKPSKPSSQESTNLMKRTMPAPEGDPRPKRVRVMEPEVSQPDNTNDNGGNDVEMPTPGGIDELQQPSNDSQLENDSPSPVSESNTDAGRSIPSDVVDGGRKPDSQQVPDTSQHSSPAEKVIKAMAAELSRATVNGIEGEIFCFEAMFPAYAGEPEQDPLKVFKATSDPDTMYHHEAMRQKDAAKFIEAMDKEWNDQLENGNFTIIHRSEVPEGATILPAVWQMKRKRDIRTRQIKKYKARLNLDGSKMVYGKHYDQTYAPVASWNSIRTLLTVSALYGWHTRQIDYVLAFPQAPIEREIYMKIPAGFKVKDGSNKDYVLRLHRNVYGGKAASRTWYQYLSNILINEVGFKRSEVDECVFYRGNVMYVLYTDDSLLAGPNLAEVEQAIKDIRAAKLNITEEGDIQDFLGVHIDKKPDGTVHLTQPHLIDQILGDLNMQENTKVKSLPAACSKLLSRHSDSDDFDGSFNYRSIIGKLNYLEKGSRPDIAYITHQCARFSTCPKEEHANAIRWLARYLKGTRDKGTILRPNKDKGLEVYVDADFAGNWDPKEHEDPDTARSRHGYFITFAGCPIVWKSQLQTEIALSSTESEYTGLSYALREAIPIMNLFKEMIENGIPIESAEAKVHCKVFEDNTGALEIAKVHKFRPRTKHLNNRLHHFRSYVNNGITIHKIDTKEQPADMLTKPLNEELLFKFRLMMMGW